jgi:Na+/proline symporter
MVDSLSHHPGLPGLFVSGLFSGTLSTISSGVNALAAVAIQDFIRPFKPNMSDEAAAKLSYILTIGFGVISVGVAYLAQLLGGILTASFTIFGVIGGPLLGLFSLGMFCRFANSTVSFPILYNYVSQCQFWSKNSRKCLDIRIPLQI